MRNFYGTCRKPAWGVLNPSVDYREVMAKLNLRTTEGMNMMLKMSLDQGNTWSEYEPALIDFEQYPATLLRFVEGDNEEKQPFTAPMLLEATEAA